MKRTRVTISEKRQKANKIAKSILRGGDALRAVVWCEGVFFRCCRRWWNSVVGFVMTSHSLNRPLDGEM